jgi:hypothetical protein
MQIIRPAKVFNRKRVPSTAFRAWLFLALPVQSGQTTKSAWRQRRCSVAPACAELSPVKMDMRLAALISDGQLAAES